MTRQATNTKAHTHTHTHTHEQASGANAGWLMKLSAKDFSRFFVVVVLFR